MTDVLLRILRSHNLFVDLLVHFVRVRHVAAADKVGRAKIARISAFANLMSHHSVTFTITITVPWLTRLRVELCRLVHSVARHARNVHARHGRLVTQVESGRALDFVIRVVGISAAR